MKKNREKAYYNSPMHFCRSLYANKLKENGYVVYDTLVVPGTNIFASNIKDFNFQLDYPDSNSVEINGLDGIELHLLYSDSFGKPLNLAKVGYRNLYFSEIRFKSNKVKIRKDGTIPNDLIMFQGTLGKKMVGASLPGDFEIETK
ncbi:MAG: hypothetical protein JW833_09180 [Prolixibacteraceae bacterium]|nr:hypothetical protein [Prolixibacteraceae bacterium]